MYTFNQLYRGFDKGYTLKAGEVSDAQIRLFKKKGVLEADPQPHVPESSNFTVAQVKAKVKSMKIEEAFAFTKGDTRKMIARLRDELVQSA